jgi:hypothetical protein
MFYVITGSGSWYTKCALGAALWAAGFASQPGLAGSVRVHVGPSVTTEEAAFFAFDLDSVPFRRNLHLTMVAPTKHPEPVLKRGPDGSPDEMRAEFYGSVIKVNGKYRMWYCGLGFDDPARRNAEDIKSWVLYAESGDGLHWIKPHLGLVEFRGSHSNNIVKIDLISNTAFATERNVHVLYEPEDPDSSRRYKMLLHVPHEGGRMTMVPLFSADGLTWRYALPTQLTDERKPRFKLSSIAMPNEHLEGGGLVKFDGVYYVNGQSENLYDGSKAGRLVAGYWSSDFVHWHPEKSEAQLRAGFNPKTFPGDGPETHEGVAIWNRGNVLIGISGHWQGATNWSGRRIDLGLVTSVNGYQFREPVTDFIFVRAGEQGAWDAGGLLQGQAFEQVGEETWMWYGSWNLAAGGNTKAYAKDALLLSQGDIGLLKLRRDGFGFVSLLDPKAAKQNDTFGSGKGSLMTVPFEITGSHALLEANVEVAAESRVSFELLDRAGVPVPGYNAIVERSGLRVPVSWKGKRSMAPGVYRLRASLERHGTDSPKLYAFYVTTAIGAR